jgi:predicted DNA-binding ribbon-helix-helix protein
MPPLRRAGGRGHRSPLPCFDSVFHLVQSFQNLKNNSGEEMDIQQIIMRPITTLEYPDPAEARRFINDEYGVYGYDYVFLEDATWNALCATAGDENCTVDNLCADIDLNFADGGDFAPAARLYVLRYVADRIPQSIALPPELLFLRELAAPARFQ